MTATVPPGQQALTPTVRDVARRARFWAAVGVVLLAAVAIVTVISSSSLFQHPKLSPTSPAPAGAKALVTVLGDHGVEVAVPGDYEQASTALEGGDATLVLVDPSGILSPQRLTSIVDEAASAIVIAPTSDALATLSHTVHYADHASSSHALDAQCPLPAADGLTLRDSDKAFTVEDGALGCFLADDAAQIAVDGTTTFLADGTFLDNEHVLYAGHAALGLRLASAHDALVWYLPTLADADVGQAATVASLTPSWVTPVAVLLFVTALCAILWRGRRFGPLIVEDLPVTVRARETMEGRARLYARSASRLRALDALRIGSLDRLAATLGLARAATTDEIVAAIAVQTGQHRTDLTDLLVAFEPESDRDLVDASHRLADLEAAVSQAVRPASLAPTDSDTKE